MTSRSFRRLFPQLNVQSIPEDEFYRQASLSQLLTGPDEQELASFRPDIKDPLELVEATPELAGMLGSSMEFVDTRYLESSPPPTPPPPASLNLPPEQQEGASSKTDGKMQNTTVKTEQLQGLKHAEISLPAAKTETKMTASMWEVQQQASKNPGGATNVTINVNMWEPSKDIRIANSASKVESNTWQLQRQSRVAPEHVNSVHSDPRSRVAVSEAQRKSHPDCSTLEQSSQNTGNASSASPEPKVDASTRQQQQLGNYSTRNTPATHDVKVTQRLRCRTAGNTDAGAPSGPQQTLTNCDSDDSNGTVGGAAKQQNQTKTLGATKTLVDGRVWEMQRLRSKNSGTTDPEKSNATVDVSKWKQQEIKRTGSIGTATKREASFCDLSQGAKSIKLDPAWQRSLGNVRVHIRDLGMKVVGGTTIQRDLKKEQGKVSAKAIRAKTRS